MSATSLIASPERAAELKKFAGDWPSYDLKPSEVDRVEMLLRGLFAPEKSIELAIGGSFQSEDTIALRDPEGVVLAALTVSQTTSDGKVTGELEGLALPLHYDHADLREDLDAKQGLALVTGTALHRSAIEAANVAAEHKTLTVYALVGGHTDPFSLVRQLKAALPHLPAMTRLRLLPLSPEDTESREALAKNLNASALLAPAPGDSEDTFPEIAAELERSSPPRDKQGLTVFFTGLSGSGKSTIANVLRVKLSERGGRKVTLLDGDLVRKSLSSELTFSKPHRNINILRIGYVAAEITKHGGLAVCAPIAPYDDIRKQVRAGVEAQGGFVLVHVATPLEVCEARDRKGLYAMARAGKIPEFTGISDPYEEPEDAELVIQTTEMSAEQACDKVIAYLESEGYLA